MATPCVLWCLVLVDLILISSGTELVQTSPSYTPLCHGDRLVLTCTTTTGAAFWKIPGHDNQAEEILGPTTIEGLMLNVTNKDGNTVTTTGIYESISVSLNGSEISCAGENSIINPQFVTITINITDSPVAVTDININPIEDSSILITWLYQQNIQCIVNYTVMINDSNVSSQYSSIGNNITLTSLIIGTNYSFIIIPIDTIGREGPPSSLIQYIWNVPAQVISSDSVTIWWNDNTENSVQRPPTQYYTFNVFNAPISYNTTYTFTLDYTNVTIGELLTDTNYTVTIIPGNAIGYGPSVTVNGQLIIITTDVYSSLH
uniref:Fibronectin type-III domain-containing protein n=1 Tax=Amphimedon queenslandica TaxID=400682 RepID=A0A1X7T5E0_AMPQE